jgi:transposase
MNEPKPKRIKKQYDEAFRRSAVALVESSGRPLKEIAAELGVTHWNLRDWTKKHGRNKPVQAATPAEMQREMARLRRENQSLQARCEVLKKHWAFLPNQAAALRTNEGVAGRVCDRRSVRGFWRIPQRLSPLARCAAECSP